MDVETAELIERAVKPLSDRRVVPPLGERKPFGDTPPARQDLGTGRDRSDSWSCWLSYVNAKGEASERRFTAHKLVGYGRVSHVHGYCHERGRVTTLIVERIGTLADLVTGEILDPVDHFFRLRVEGALGVEDHALGDVVQILTFLAKCDHHLHPLETGAIVNHIDRFCIRFDGCNDMAKRALKAKDKIAPDAQTFEKALIRVAESGDLAPKLARFLIDCGADVIDADGRHAPEELLWAGELSQLLRHVASYR